MTSRVWLGSGCSPIPKTGPYACVATVSLTTSFEDLPSSLDEGLSSERLRVLPKFTKLHRKPKSPSVGGGWPLPGPHLGFGPPPSLPSVLFGSFPPLEKRVREQGQEQGSWSSE